MNVATFGGTFDPIHNGHLAVARAARERFGLKTIYFIPADAPPHKLTSPLTPFEHRYAMVCLAVAGEKEFVPSLIEQRYSPNDPPNYSIVTVRRIKAQLKRNDRLFFIIGADSLRDLASWYEPEALLRECEFIVASRPGYSLADVANSLPEAMRPKAEVIQALRGQQATGEIVLTGARIHLLSDVNERVSATQIRDAAAGKRNFGRLVPPAVAEYVKKLHLYENRTEAPRGKVVRMPRRRTGRTNSEAK